MPKISLTLPDAKDQDSPDQPQGPPAPPPPPPPPINFAQFASNPANQAKVAAVVPGLQQPQMPNLPPPAAPNVQGPQMQSMQDWQQQNPQLQEKPRSGFEKALQIAAGIIGGGVPGGVAAGRDIHQHDLPAGLQGIDQQRYQQAVVQPFQQQQQIADTQAQMQQRAALAGKASAQADEYAPQVVTPEQAQALGMPQLAGASMNARDLANLSGVQARANATTTAATTRANATENAANSRANATTTAATIRANTPKGGRAASGTPAAGSASFEETVKAIGEGRMAPPRYSSKTAALLNAVTKAYPDFDATKFGTYQASQKDFTSGTDAHSVNSFNTALEHLGRAEQNMPGNGRVPFVNGLHNALLRASGDPSLSAFDTDRTAVSAEIAKAYKGGVINKEEHDEYERLLNPNASPDQMKANFGELKQLLGGKLESFNYQRQQGQPATSGGPIMSPGASKVMNEGQTFNATKWAAAHPGKDVNAAIAAAKRKGYKVVQ